MRIGYDRREAALALALAFGLVTLAMAWMFELLLGYVPCKLCLWQRWPYYVGLPLAVVSLLTFNHGSRVDLARAIAGAVALVFLVSIGLGLYHAGVEWKFWAGPADCGGRIIGGPPSVQDFRKALETARMVSCTDAPLRMLGLSFAGWNAVISAFLMALALRATTAQR
ncbi:DsbB Disulfide bond formation protein DsbB [Rhabdaerophilaceae bacterium]